MDLCINVRFWDMSSCHVKWFLWWYSTSTPWIFIYFYLKKKRFRWFAILNLLVQSTFNNHIIIDFINKLFLLLSCSFYEYVNQEFNTGSYVWDELYIRLPIWTMLAGNWFFKWYSKCNNAKAEWISVFLCVQ